MGTGSTDSEKCSDFQKELEVAEQDEPGPVTALSSISCPLPIPSHNQGQNWLWGAGFHRNKSCVTSSAPWGSIIDKGARPEPWAGPAKCGGSRRTWQKVENRTGLGPHIFTRNRVFQNWCPKSRPRLGTRPLGHSWVWSKNILKKIPGGWGSLAKHDLGSTWAKIRDQET